MAAEDESGSDTGDALPGSMPQPSVLDHHDKAFVTSPASLSRVLPALLNPGKLRAIAERARSARNFSVDCYYRRLICFRPGASGGDWLQYGHSLKELGFFRRAEDAYRRARDKKPDDPEISLQLGHLLKLMDRLEEASASFNDALRLGYADTGHVEFELGLIRKAYQPAIHWEKNRQNQPSGTHIYLSVPGRAFAEGSKADLGNGLGNSDYSYSFAMRGFVEALDELEMDYTLIDNPEFIADIRDRSNAAINIHLGFYPPERMRLLKGAYNINCFAWEFERLRSIGEVTGYHAFADQATMLAIADELWVPSAEGAEVVAKSVDRPVKFVPAPVISNMRKKPRTARPDRREIERLARDMKDIDWQPLAVLPRIQGTMNDMARSRQSTLRSILYAHDSETVPPIFVTVLNVHDFRKQLRPMIEGFLQFSLRHPEALLLIKMTTPDRGKLTINEFLIMDQISNAGDLVPPMVSDRIWITDNILTREEMNRLYDVAGYYLCTSYAEGQNLPLIEAMGRGAVPVSVDHTAMKTYIDSENAIVVRSELRMAEPRLTTRYGMYGIATHYVTAAAVLEALDEAVGISSEDYARRSANAFETVRGNFGISRFAEHLNDVVQRLEQIAGKEI